MTASAATILAAIRISAVYRALTGVEPRRTVADTFRVRAAWRNGDGPNVALDDSRGVWHDFVTDEGGGVLDLIVRVHGGTRQEALRWAADYAGVSLDDNKLSPAERAEWAKKRKDLSNTFRMPGIGC